MTNHAISTTAVVLFVVGSALLLGGCEMVGEAEAGKLEAQVETGHPALHYVDRLREPTSP